MYCMYCMSCRGARPLRAFHRVRAYRKQLHKSGRSRVAPASFIESPKRREALGVHLLDFLSFRVQLAPFGQAPAGGGRGPRVSRRRVERRERSRGHQEQCQRAPAARECTPGARRALEPATRSNARRRGARRGAPRFQQEPHRG